MNPEETLAVWRAQESKVRERLARTTGYVRPEQLDGRSGLETLQAIFAGELPSPPMGHTLGFVPIRVERGRAIFQGTPDSRYYNPLGTVHGGWFTALLDSAMGCAVHSMLPAAGGTTLELKVNIVRPLTEAVPLVRAEGILVHGGRQVATAEGRILGPDSKLYAHATTTCLIFDHADIRALSSRKSP
jgi:uncharacterized protein (TIGR00369 family)